MEMLILERKTLTNPHLINCNYNVENSKTPNGLCLSKKIICICINKSLPSENYIYIFLNGHQYTFVHIYQLFHLYLIFQE